MGGSFFMSAMINAESVNIDTVIGKMTCRGGYHPPAGKIILCAGFSNIRSASFYGRMISAPTLYPFLAMYFYELF